VTNDTRVLAMTEHRTTTREEWQAARDALVNQMLDNPPGWLQDWGR
jgi:hypothetical protein